MNKLLIGIISSLVVLSGCSTVRSTANNSDPTGYCVSERARVGDVIQTRDGDLKIQWISGPTSNCVSRQQVQAKLVLPNEFIPAPMYENLINEGSWGTRIVTGLLGMYDVSAHHARSINTRECLVAPNYRAWSCVPQSGTNPHNVQVSGYTRANGTYVATHNRTAPNSTKTDNYSYSGNVNPYTGRVGTQQ